MRSTPTSFLKARLAALYLISLSAVESSLFAWTPERMIPPQPASAYPVALAAAALFGALLHDRLAGLVERSGRGRIRFVMGAPYAVLLGLLGLGLAAGSKDAAESAGPLLRLLQPAALLLAGMGRGYLGTLVNALALTVYTALAGGAGAMAAVSLHGGLVVFFLAADFASRRLLEYPVQEMPGAWPVLREGLGWSALTLAGLLLFFHAVPPLPYEPLVRSGALRSLPPDALTDLLLYGLGACLLGVGGLWLALRFGFGSSGASGGDDVEVVAARGVSEAVVLPPAPAAEAIPSGWRGRIVRLYLDHLAGLARLGRRRGKAQTPGEFARTVEPVGEAALLAAAFGRARWGGEEPGEADFEAARRAGEAVLDRQRGRNLGGPGGV